MVFEDLQIQNMTASAAGTLEEPGTNVSQKSGLNRAILDKGWGKLHAMTAYKAAHASRRNGAKTIILLVNPAHTSQTCSACDATDDKSRDGVQFCCAACGFKDHADINASRTIRSRGLEDVALACGLAFSELPDDLVARPGRGGAKMPDVHDPAGGVRAGPA